MTTSSKLRNKPRDKKSYGLASQCRAKQKPCAYDNVTGVSLQNTDVQELERDKKICMAKHRLAT